MAITKCQPMPDNVSLQPTPDMNFVLKETWVVETDTANAAWTSSNPLFFIGDPLFPSIGTAHPRNSSLRFSTFDSMEQKKSNLFYFTGMTFDTRQRLFDDDFNKDRFDNESKRDIDWSFTAIQVPLWRAPVADVANSVARPIPAASFSASPRMVATTANEPVSGLMETIYLPQANLVRNQLVVPAGIVTGPIVGAVNSDVFTLDGLTIAAQTCLIKDCTISKVNTSIKADGNRTNFRTVRYVLALNRKGWDLEMLNAGFYEVILKPGSSPAQYGLGRIFAPDGWDQSGGLLKPVAATSPLPIDINGKRIKTFNGEPGYNPNWLDEIHYRVYRNATYVPFAGFGFN